MKRVLGEFDPRPSHRSLWLFSGKKICLHLHGVFPYLLVKSPTDEMRYGEQLAQSLDKAINLSFEKGDPETNHVYDIKLVELL
jgi:DNA polymerase zeta